MAIYTVHAGHAADGKSFCGASGFCKESTEARKIKNAVIKYLKDADHTVYDCTVDSGTSQSNIIYQIKQKINSHSGVTCNISIHLNASNGAGHGTETLVYSNSGLAGTIAKRVCDKISNLGYRSRGVKIRTNLGVLKGITNGGANILVETFFCDNEDDYNLYKEIGADGIGKAIAEGILGITINDSTPKPSTPAPSVPASNLYRVRKSWADAKSQIGAYSNLDNAKANCKIGYSVFDSNGNVVYSNIETPTPQIKPIQTNSAPTQSNVLKQGNRGDAVKTMQNMLNVCGYDCGKADGIFGSGTKNALVKMQKANGLVGDGIYGAKSKAKLEELYKAKTAPKPVTPPSSKPSVNTNTYSKTQFIKDVQSAIGAKVDGIAGNETLSKTVTISKSKNNKHAVVKAIQKYLNVLGYNCGTADGIAGSKFDSAVKAYQKANGCVSDGEITAKGKTWKKLLGLA